MLRVLSLLEARVLGVLVEKERTVPDSYPLTLNALVAGCNQKSSRDPVLNAAETDVRAAVDGLKSMLLAIERSGERVARYAHNVERMMNVPQQAAALLAVLMLRGPQTAGELRMNCERLHCFADIPSKRGKTGGDQPLAQRCWMSFGRYGISRWSGTWSRDPR
jgi:uncharacterized protein